MTALAATGVAKACGDGAGGNQITRNEGLTDERGPKMQDASLEDAATSFRGDQEPRRSAPKNCLLSL